MTNHDLHELLYRAIHTPCGIMARSHSADRLRQKLYAYRRTLDDPQLADLSFTPSPTDPAQELWIINKGAPHGE